VKTLNHPRVFAELTEELNTELEKVGSNIRVKDPSKLKKFVKSKDWKSTVGYGKCTRAEAFHQRFDELGIFDQSFRSQFLEKFDFEEKVVLPEMKALLKEIKKKEGVELGILSNHCLELRSWLGNDRYDIVPRLIPSENVVISAEIGVKKPHEDAYRNLLETLSRSKCAPKSKRKSLVARTAISYALRAKSAAQRRLGSRIRKKSLRTETPEEEGTEAQAEEEIELIDPLDVLFIDNRENNIEAAHNMGFATFLYKYDPNLDGDANVSLLRESILNFFE